MDKENSAPEPVVDSSEKWKRFNLIFWPMAIAGLLGTLSLSADFPEGSIGGILLNLFAWIGQIIQLIGLPIVIGYFASVIGGSRWYFLIGFLGIGGLIIWPILIITYLIVFKLHKKKTGRLPIVIALIVLAFLLIQFFYGEI